MTAIPSNANLDDYKTPGNYYAASNVVAASLTNCPVNMAFRLTVEKGISESGSQLIQTIIAHNSSNPYRRVFYSDTWRQWAMPGYDYSKNITSGSINDIFTPGFYYLEPNATDLPEGVNGSLYIFRVTAVICRQFFIRLGTGGSNDGNLYVRQGNLTNKTWSNWWKFTGTLVS